MSTPNLCFRANNVYPCKPQFYFIKVGLKGSISYGHVCMMQLGKKRQNITPFLLAMHPKQIHCVLKFDKLRAAEYKQVSHRTTIAHPTAIIIL